ncbi:hypothetical protein MKY34_19625 [Sporosarcina sp. FSL K6-1522]|uniref:hypothetical protein n=1 Tax=Sporosarcina sp. FSL K6-1522 TaxID=2921554 RepID=UPI00315B023A
MTKLDKEVLYAEVHGVKVGLPQFYDENDNPVVISTNTPMPVTVIGGTGGTNGKSAYEIAVDNGFIGDEAAWLASLKGEKGDRGTDGTNGTNGDKGDAFTYADFTQEELDALKGSKGDPGTSGNDGFGTQAQYEDIIQKLEALETP